MATWSGAYTEPGDGDQTAVMVALVFRLLPAI